MLDALQRLDAPRVEAWAAALGLARATLHRRSRRWLGGAPKAVCAAYVRACVQAMRQESVPGVVIADALGYADAATLRRTLRTSRRTPRAT